MAESWSMEVKGIFRDVNLLTSLAKLKAEVRQAGEYIKSTTVEMKRMASEAKVLGGLLSLIGAGGFAALLMSAPRTAAALAKLKTWLELIFLILDEHLSPAVEWLADKFEGLYKWLKNLEPEEQKFIAWLVAAAAILAPVAAALSFVWRVGGWLLKVVKGLWKWFANLGSKLLGFVESLLGSAGLSAALGIIAGLIGVIALDKIGFMKWVRDMGEGFRQWLHSGTPLADIINVLATALFALGDLINVLLTDKTMEDWWRQIDSVTASYKRLLKVMTDIPKKMVNLGSRAIGKGDVFDVGVKDVGGMASYTGLHWLKAGEQVSMQGTSSSQSGAGGTTVTNDFGGATFVLQNGLDIDDFVELISRKQSEKSAWGAF